MPILESITQKQENHIDYKEMQGQMLCSQQNRIKVCYLEADKIRYFSL